MGPAMGWPCRRSCREILGLLLLIGGCANVPFQPAGRLSSYAKLAPSNGYLTHASIAVDKDKALAASTVAIAPTTFSEAASKVALSQMQRDILANVVDRSLCIGLSDRFHVVAFTQPADVSVHATITYIGLTDEKVAAASEVANVGATVAENVFLPTPIPIPKPRIPVGMGGLAAEAEALDATGRQVAAMVWARGADALTSKPKVSIEGDAYDLARVFADDFSRLLVTGSTPFKKLHLPSINAINASLGGKPKEAACDTFGRGPGVTGLIGDAVGLPPEWTDKGAPKPSNQQVVAQ
jgi:Protein of unknown function (DUF3313)